MGNLLRLLSRDHETEGNVEDLFVDFENAEPTEVEREVYLEVKELLEEARIIIHSIRDYKGATAEIREAISNPTIQELQRVALDAIDIKKLYSFYSFSQRLVEVVPHLLKVLCSANMTPTDHLRTQQALVKAFAELLDFVLSFDDLKMSKPSIQNDLSYYRRTKSRNRIIGENNGGKGDGGGPDSPESGREAPFNLPDDVANIMSLFYAHATPMLHILSDITSKFVVNNHDIDYLSVTVILSTMAKVCVKMIENKEFYERFDRKEETVFFILRVMVGVIILYDHVHPSGVFTKSSPIDIKECIRVLKDQPTSESLLNALRYTTRHLNDPQTSKTIRALLS